MGPEYPPHSGPSQATSVLSPLLDAEVHVGREGEVCLQARTVASGETALFGNEVQGKGVGTNYCPCKFGIVAWLHGHFSGHFGELALSFEQCEVRMPRAPQSVVFTDLIPGRRLKALACSPPLRPPHDLLQKILLPKDHPGLWRSGGQVRPGGERAAGRATCGGAVMGRQLGSSWQCQEEEEQLGQMPPRNLGTDTV